MCGRYTLTKELDEIVAVFELDGVPSVPWYPRYNISPTQPIPVILGEDKRTLQFMRWGLVPSWAKDISIGNRLFNARSETAHEKPSFRAAFKRRRCLIPADGFFEWKKSAIQGGGSVPFYFHLENHSLFSFAGLWDEWMSADGDTLASCTILTCAPNQSVSDIHSRMPVILDKEDRKIWLQSDRLIELQGVLKPYQAQTMLRYSVSKRVNSGKYDDAQCIEPEESSGSTLF